MLISEISYFYMLLSDAHRRRVYQILSPILRINVGLKTILRQGLADPEFYGDLVYIFKKIIGRTIISDLLKNITRYKRVGYN